MAPTCVFILSPADLAGKRAEQLLRTSSRSEAAVALRSSDGVRLCDLFSVISPLYFRGKHDYARTFARPPEGVAGVHVVLPAFGMRPADSRLTRDDVRLVRETGDELPAELVGCAARELSARLAPDTEVVFLGSIASDRYLPGLATGLADRLLVPDVLIGMGMMPRGALLRRCADSGDELDYVPPPAG